MVFPDFGVQLVFVPVVCGRAGWVFGDFVGGCAFAGVLGLLICGVVFDLWCGVVFWFLVFFLDFGFAVDCCSVALSLAFGYGLRIGLVVVWLGVGSCGFSFCIVWGARVWVWVSTGGCWVLGLAGAASVVFWCLFWV